MKRASFLLIFAALVFPPVLPAVEPESCVRDSGVAGSVTAEFEGKVYHLASIECRELFLSDPERYSQLFDALAELGPVSSPSPQDRVALVPN